MQYKKFVYSDLEDMKKDINLHNLGLNVTKNLEVLKKSVRVSGFNVPNSLAVHPMEGCDGNIDGSPGELVLRRYKRFAGGGAGLIWFEAVAIAPGGRANPRQLWINDNNFGTFKELKQLIIKEANDKNGYSPLIVMQLTHSGRFSVPYDKPEPVIAYNNPYLNQRMDLGDDYPVITDAELERLEDKYVEAAKLAKKAGFHGVDVKACHRYLISELLSAYNRKGKYGCSFENRTRFMLNIIDKIKSEVGEDFLVCTRLNLYDGIPFPYGWGTDKEDFTKYDLTEPLKLVEELYNRGVRLINITMGTPYYNPHVNRPYDSGGYTPKENQLEGVVRLINGAAEVQKHYPDMVIVGTGYSWLRDFAPNVAAAAIEDGKVKIAGFGRAAFAYPDFAKDILNKGAMERKKCCITCGKCTELMRAKSFAGCVIRDSDVYGPLYKKDCMK